MDAMSSLNSTSKDLVKLLAQDFPKLTFQEARQEHWSPKKKTVFYSPDKPCFGLLHELAHALFKIVWILTAIGCTGAALVPLAAPMSYKAIPATTTVLTAILHGALAADVS
jgi:hypothetical protein